MLSPGLRFAADEVFISTTPGEDEAARDSLLALGIQQTQLHFKEQRLLSTRIDPLITAGWKLMVLISVGVIVVVSAIAYAVYILAFATRGRGEAGTLRSLGLTRSQMMGLLGIEHIAISVIGLVLGNWAGFQMSKMMVSTLAITETGDPVIPPFLLRTEWGFMAPVYIVLVLVILTAIFAVYRAIGRMRLHEISRVEI
jgi:ABC-type antimicrobial peptide transport system permease subunit